jgi:Protein of unknown function (DUF4236)/Bacterial SH3 domain
MGWRFRNSVKILPGIRLNFGKSGISTSIGGRGASLNIGSKGTRSTVGVPGTGISYSTLHTETDEPSGNNVSNKGGCGCWSVVGGLALLFAIARCGSSNELAPIASNEKRATVSTNLAATETVYVSGASINGRAHPSTTADVTQKLNQGDALVIVERKGDWTKVVKAGVTMWVATRYISEKFVSPPASAQPSTLRSASKPKQRVSQTSRGGMCPCSARQVCIGPRGGRYCMTSSGRKRYGI